VIQNNSSFRYSRLTPAAANALNERKKAYEDKIAKLYDENNDILPIIEAVEVSESIIPAPTKPHVDFFKNLTEDKKNDIIAYYFNNNQTSSHLIVKSKNNKQLLFIINS
jgi:hypothetical protein